jgi:hypothetical protein
MRLELDGRELRAMAGDTALFHYVYRPDMPRYESPKPYLHPVRTLAGDVVTAYRPHDHVWHKGIAMTVSHLSGENFWGGPSYVRDRGYVDLPNHGAMLHEEFTTLAEDPAAVCFGERLSWVTQAGERWVSERRELSATLHDGHWILEFRTALTNVRGAPLEFGSPATNGRPLAGYSGLLWRGPRSFTGGMVLSANGGDPGAEGGAMMGEGAPWIAYVGAHDEVDRVSTLVFMDDTAVSGHWFVRSRPYPAMNPSPCFATELELPQDATLERRYRLVVAGAPWDADRIKEVLG